ncbi:hypothetical protein ACFS5J_02470 [Flavobacterium chuncheonense]|uniref:Uncharacterized protein n=1 Tax=Flavobacterium chuncheonense TaxID=2026653 RepID=A0ABW5YIF6_9FLAO
MSNTFNDYCGRIAREIPKARDNDDTGFLVKPSPAQLRNYCEILYQTGLNAADLKTFKSFFQIPQGEDDVLKFIKNIDIDKFRPVKNYLEGSIKIPSLHVVEMTAILIKFKQRPYSNFKSILTDKEIISNIETVNEEEPEEVTELNVNEISARKSNYKKLGLISLVGVLVLFFGIYGFNRYRDSYTKVNCMQWTKDHYEIVDCDKTSQHGFVIQNSIELYNSDLFKLKKVNVNGKTVFFKNDKAVIYYSKLNDSVIECYNLPGFHPITGKPLRPITNYMIKKYIKNKE